MTEWWAQLGWSGALLVAIVVIATLLWIGALIKRRYRRRPGLASPDRACDRSAFTVGKDVK